MKYDTEEIEAAAEGLKEELTKSGWGTETTGSLDTMLDVATQVVRDHRELRDRIEAMGGSLEARAAEIERDVGAAVDAAAEQMRDEADRIQEMLDNS